MIRKDDLIFSKKTHSTKLDTVQQNKKKRGVANINVFSSKQTLETKEKQNRVKKRSYVHIFVLFGILSCVLLITHTTEATAEVFLSSWGSEGRDDGQFDKPWGIAIDSAGNVYVVDTNNHRVQKFTSDGVFITSWGSLGRDHGKFLDPHGIAIDSAGNVYVVDTNNERVQKFTSDGVFITSWGSLGRDHGKFLDPHGIAIDSAGNVYVVDTNNERVQKFTSDGVFITSWGSSGTGEGQFQKPWGIAIDSAGNVYVDDIDNNRIQKFTSDGVFITSWGSEILQFPKNIHVSPNDDVYVADTGNHLIQIFTSSGELITTLGSPGRGQGSFLAPTGIAVNSEGEIYVVDHTNNRIQIFTSLIYPQNPGIPVPPLDTQDPTLVVPSSIVMDTENERGSRVSFGVTASDNIGVIRGPSCNHSSESLFPIGTTLVTCKAHDAAGNVGIASFEIIIDYKVPLPLDTQDPTLVVPSSIVMDTENERGSRVSFGVTASDNIGVIRGPSCNHSSESLFPIGTTLVTCKAHDAAGNVGIASFEIIINKTSIDYTTQYAVAIAGITSMSAITLAYKAGFLTSKVVGMSNTSTTYSVLHNDGSSSTAVQSDHSSVDLSSELSEKIEIVNEQSSVSEKESQFLHAPRIEIEVSWGFGK